MARVGRPPLFSCCMDLAAAADLYFEDCDERGAPYTMSGCSYACGFNDRRMLNEYGKRDEFADAVARIRARIEAQRSEALLTGASNVVGSIFYLKANHDWQDKQQVELSGAIGIGGLADMVADALDEAEGAA